MKTGILRKRNNWLGISSGVFGSLLRRVYKINEFGADATLRLDGDSICIVDYIPSQYMPKGEEMHYYAKESMAKIYQVIYNSKDSVKLVEPGRKTTKAMCVKDEKELQNYGSEKYVYVVQRNTAYEKDAHALRIFYSRLDMFLSLLEFIYGRVSVDSVKFQEVMALQKRILESGYADFGEILNCSYYSALWHERCKALNQTNAYQEITIRVDMKSKAESNQPGTKEDNKDIEDDEELVTLISEPDYDQEPNELMNHFES